jgi:hypothetical protein
MMRLTRFYALTYAIGIEVDGREYMLSLPYDGAAYEAIQAQAKAAYDLTLPDMSKEVWAKTLNSFIADAIENQIDIGPISRINRIVTDRDPDPRKH